MRIEEYGLIGDCESAALVGLDGSIDWLCWPRFDSDACFAALLGDESHGRWLIAPTEADARVTRRYRDDTLILETRFETASGVVILTDFMVPETQARTLVRLVNGVSGQVDMGMQFVLRFGYGAAVPWVTRLDDGGLRAVAGPDMVVLRTPVAMRGEGMTTVSQFTIGAGEAVPFTLVYGHSHRPAPQPTDLQAAMNMTRSHWQGWSRAQQIDGPYQAAIERSLLTLKALTYARTGGLVAAPTTSLPEAFGGTRNWDYRYCWIRDAALTLLALMSAGHFEEARDWAAWLHRAVAGDPADMQIMYGVAGERRLREWEADWLPGYEGSTPVRIGNAAHQQFQLDIYGELMDAFHQARRAGVMDDDAWEVQRTIIGHVAKVWRQPDQGIWESRGPPAHYTYSKVMAWVVMDRAVQAVEVFGLDGGVDDWRALREEIRHEVMANGRDPATGAFQRAYGDPGLDASLLLLAELGFVSPADPSFLATVAAVERTLLVDEIFVRRYDTSRVDDGLPPGEAAFLPCSFWLANAYGLTGRTDEARSLFERLLGLTNDLGLISEEYDPATRRLAGNFPQAFSHVALLTTALNLSHSLKPSLERRQDSPLPGVNVPGTTPGG